MYKEETITLLLADDEAEIRSGLRTIIRWEDYGIELLGTARNGAEALDMIRYHEPDIVITDIQMPGINGLELIRRAKEEQFDCLFVILSGYDDFQYAQTAIKQGVHDYILKPVVIGEFIELIKRLTSEIILKRNLYQNQVKLSKNLNAANKTITQQNFISELLREELNQNHIDTILERDRIPLHSGSSAAVVLHIYEQSGLTPAAGDEAIEGSIAATMGFLERYYQGTPTIYAHMNRSSVVAFHNTESADRLYSLTDLMLQELESGCGIRAFGAVGPLTDTLKDIHESFRIANQVVSWHIYPDMGRLANASILASVDSQNLIKDERIIGDIRRCDIDALKQDLDKYTSMLFFTPYPPPAYLFSMYNFLIMDIRSQLSDAGLQSYTGDAYQAMRQFDTFDQIKNWVYNILIEYTNELSVLQAKSQDPLIQKAVDYITENIFNKVGAEDVCQYIGYSKSYFSKYFRQKTNLNFRDYILDLKITYAQQQLKINAQTPKEVAFMLGYEEYSSFSRAFKTRTGFSPSDYQKSFY
ncbi:MAG: response regulator transcription factor [Lachnospiraceae bacterium]